MKKLVLIISIIAVVVTLSVCLSACNNATTQGQLANVLSDHNHESFVYDVYAADANGTPVQLPEYVALDSIAHGTYTVTLDAYQEGESVANFGKGDLTNVKRGVLVLSTLVFVTHKYTSGCYYQIVSGSSYMVPAYTFRLIEDDGQETFYMYGEYSGTSLNYTKVVDGQETSGTLSAKKGTSTLYDNNQFHQTLRCITTYSSNFSFSFKTPIVSNDEDTLATLSASISSTSYVKGDFSNGIEKYQEKGVPCYKMSLARSTQVAGLTQTLFYATEDITLNGWNMKNVLVRIEEPFKLDNGFGKMVYELTSASLS